MDSDKNEEDEDKKPKAAAREAPEGERNVVPAVTKSRRGRHKRPKDMPTRPLSAYNLFFAEERERILFTQRQGIAQPDFVYPSEAELQQHASTGKKKPPALFQALAKCIGGRWRALPQISRTKYEVQAKEEKRLYKQKIATYQHAMVVKSIAESENKRLQADGGDESETSDQKPPAKKEAKFSLKTERDEKDEVLPPQQIQFYTDSGLAGSPQSTTTTGLPPHVEGASDVAASRRATAFTPTESPAAQMIFRQYSQQEKDSSNTTQTGMLAGDSKTMDSPLEAALRELLTDQRHTNPVGIQHIPIAASVLSFLTTLAPQQLPQILNMLPGSAFSQGQSDLFLQNLAMIHQDQQIYQQVQRALRGMPTQGSATVLPALLLLLQQQQGRERQQQVQGNQGIQSLLLPTSSSQGSGGGASLDTSQQGGTATGAFREGFQGLADLLVRLQEQQRQRQQQASRNNTQHGG